MKVYIGKYISYFSVDDLLCWLKYLKVSESVIDKISEYLNTTFLKGFFEWINSKRNRTEYVKIDKYDTWNMFKTLAIIIHPMLKQLKETTHGYPSDLTEEQWNIILDKMIWSFDQIDNDWEEKFLQTYGLLSDDKTRQEYITFKNQVQEGLDLFAKHYMDLWD